MASNLFQTSNDLDASQTLVACQAISNASRGERDSKKIPEGLDSPTISLRTPTLEELAQDEYPMQMANHIDAFLSASVWLTLRASRRRKACFRSRSAEKFLLSNTELDSIASDAAESTAPIATAGLSDLASPSAIMDQVWSARPGTSSLSTSIPTGADSLDKWVITVAWNDGASKENALRIAAWLELNLPTMGMALRAWSIHQAGLRWQKRWFAIRSKIKRPLLWVLLGLAIFSGVMCLPVPYYPRRKCKIEPSLRSYVASPVEGRLQAILARPGDEVKAGQLLAKLDDEQLLRELASAEAELQTHSKKRDIALASRAGADLRIAQLEIQQVQLKIDSLRDQLNRLQIVSPTDGLVVQGDWYGNEGMPVSFGQNLFEVAALNKMVAEVQLKAEDLPWVRVGSQATLRTDVSLSQAWEGKLERIEPRAEIIDDEAVFIAEMEVTNHSNLFRPGMEANVFVEGGYRSAGWILFRKPYLWLRNLWVW